MGRGPNPSLWFSVGGVQLQSFELVLFFLRTYCAYCALSSNLNPQPDPHRTFPNFNVFTPPPHLSLSWQEPPTPFADTPRQAQDWHKSKLGSSATVGVGRPRHGQHHQ